MSIFQQGVLMDVRLAELIEASDAERRVLAPLLKGWPEKTIAADLHLSQHTVHAHVRRIYRRCGVKSRSELLGNVLERLMRVLQNVDAAQLATTMKISEGELVIVL